MGSSYVVISGDTIIRWYSTETEAETAAEIYGGYAVQIMQ